MFPFGVSSTLRWLLIAHTRRGHNSSSSCFLLLALCGGRVIFPHSSVSYHHFSSNSKAPLLLSIVSRQIYIGAGDINHWQGEKRRKKTRGREHFCLFLVSPLMSFDTHTYGAVTTTPPRSIFSHLRSEYVQFPFLSRLDFARWLPTTISLEVTGAKLRWLKEQAINIPNSIPAWP